MTPLPRAQLLAPGVEFPRSELTRRVLSVFWQDCCLPLQFSRAPAPVIELDARPGTKGEPRPVRAWWLLEDGIIEEAAGPSSEALRPYLDGTDAYRLWPRYEFWISAEPFEVEMNFRRDALTVWGYHTRLVGQLDSRVRVLSREESG